MKIAHVIPSLERGGAERVVVTLANDAVIRGHEVAVITAAPGGPLSLARDLRHEIRKITLSAEEDGRFSKYVRALPFLARERGLLQSMDIIHVHLLFGTIFGTLLRAVHRPAGRPRIVETFHASGMPLATWKRAMTAAMAGCRDAFVLMAEDHNLVQALGEDKRGIVRLIPNGIDVPPAPKRKEREAARRALGVPHDAPLIGTIGRLVAEREPEKMLTLFGMLHERIPDAHFVMGGCGPLLELVRAKAREMELSSRLHLPGEVSNPLQLMMACDLYISINVGIHTGIAGLEAATATPVIAMQTLRGYQATQSDWIWSDPELESVAARATQLLLNARERATIAEAQRRAVIERYSAMAMSNAYLDLYKDLLRERVDSSSR